MADEREVSPREWDLGEILAPVAKGTTRVPFALVLLNTPIPRDHWRAFLRLWRHASFRVCADGGANRLLDSVGTGAWSGSSDLPLPNQICGDLDSLREDVRDFFAQRGVPVVHKPSQYATDLQKSVQTVEDEEAKHDAPAYPLVIFGGMSGRLDQTMHTLHVLWQLAPGAKVETMIMEPGEEGKPQPRGSTLHKRARTIVVSDESITCIIPPGETYMYVDRNVLGKTCGVLPLGSGPSGAHIYTKGLEWNLNGEASSIAGFFSTSNQLASTTEGDSAKIWIKTDAPIYWTVELKKDQYC
ncbi:ribonuclease Z [Malassezia japonica]|uniref:Thiamine pyrophosphokinase n=1 Tax=Malassezia japonica TaxID=223818 RepID=A0AAF0F5D3_9BASI|nr:ribonuclease Z [Malassezia japonica]WFD40892.1 ribonuclease Z [Malassezia japonica]